MLVKYDTGKQYLQSNHKSITLFGMSGVGKTVLADKLRGFGSWFKYHVDHRIGAHYLKDEIISTLESEVERNDAITLMTQESLRPLASFLGLPGSAELGGLTFEEYKRRQALHRDAEVRALLDAPAFFDAQSRLKEFNFAHFVCDTGGSICEVVNPDDPTDEILLALASRMLLIYIKADEGHSEELVKRFKNDPKPMYYRPDFLEEIWKEYCNRNRVTEETVDPRDFSIWGFRELIRQRKPRYQAIAEKWGITLQSSEVSDIKSQAEFDHLVADAIDSKISGNKMATRRIGVVFYRQRERQEISRAKLARHLDISVAKLRKIESGAISPSVNLEKQLFQLLFSRPFEDELNKQKLASGESRDPWFASISKH